MSTDRDLRQSIDRATAQLAEEFRGVFARETVARFVEDSLEQLSATFRVPDFLPAFTFRFARERLQALAQADRLVPKQMPEVLFVCVHNSGRSQMAAALTTHLSAGGVGVRSAGSEPGPAVDPAVAAAMDEIGVSLAEAFPKPLTDEAVRAADVVVTMGCGDACPLYPGRRYLDWEVADPAGRDIAEVRLVRDDIRERVEALLREMGALAPGVAGAGSG